MANDSKKQTAKDRFAKAKQDAEDAELATTKSDDGADAPKPTDADAPSTVVDTSKTDETADETTLTADGSVTSAPTAEDADVDTISGDKGSDTLSGGGVEDSVDPIADNPTPDDPAEDLIIPAEPAPEPDPEAEGEAAPEHDDHGDDHPGFAATALKYLIILLVGMGIALWAAPRVAPHLPAPIAAWVAPGNSMTTETEARLTEMVAEKIAAANKATADAQARADAAAADVTVLAARLDEGLATVRDDLAADIGAAGQTRGAAADRIETVAERLTAAEASLSGLRTEIDSLAGFASAGENPGAATLERVAAFGAAVEGLRAEVAALSARASEIEAAAQASDVEALEARVTALEGGEAATASARTEADEIVRSANIDAALTQLSQSLSAGRAFANPLDQLTQMTGVAVPDALAAPAATGVPSQNQLSRSFPDAAQAAYAADLKAQAGEGLFDNVLASVQGRIGGRPSVETAGSDGGAVLSRMQARLSEGALDAVQGEAQSLSPEAQAAMASWLGQLNKTIAARSGLADLRATLNTK